MKKKKVCILSNGLIQGGTDTFVVNLVNGLNKEKYDITVVLSISDDKLATREHEVLKAGAKTIRTCSITGLKGKLRHFKLLYKILKQGKYDVFQTNIDLFNGVNMLISWLAGVKIRVCHSHNSQQGKELLYGKTIPIVIYQKIMKYLCWKFSNKRSGCSGLAMDFLFGEKWKNDPNSVVVNNGIDIESFSKKRDEKLLLSKKKEIGIKSKYNIMTVGRLDIQKNPLFIVDCFAKLCQERDDCDLIWVGIGEMEEKVKSRIKSNNIENKVHMLGRRNDVEEIMHCCEVFFLPSLFEGLGIVIIEAQATGLPCVVSDVVPQEADCGSCTYMSLNDDLSSWSKTISDILDGKLHSEIDVTKLNKFSIEYMVKQMEEIFD